MTSPSLLQPIVTLLQERSGDATLPVATVEAAFLDAITRTPDPADSGLLTWLYRPASATVHAVLGAHGSPRVRSMANTGMSTAFTDEAVLGACEAVLRSVAASSPPPLGDILVELELTGKRFNESAVALQIAPGKLRVWHRRARAHALQALRQGAGRNAT